MLHKIFGRKLARNIEAGDYLEYFFVSAVTTILGIRLFLYLTGYPQISSGTFHIAHMLWGGFILALALFLLLVYLNRFVVTLAAALGGIGFGTFIDELGKFITRDNNYFFQPTIAILYVIFIFLFLLIRLVEKSQTLGKKEYLINALILFEEVVYKDLNSLEKDKLLNLLKNSDQRNGLVVALEKIANAMPVVNKENISTLKKIQQKLYEFYTHFRKSPKIQKIVLSLVFLHSISIITSSVIRLITLGGAGDLRAHLSLFSASFIDVVISFISSVIIVWGIYQFRKSRLIGLRIIKLSLLISLFISQVFSFYEIQLLAIFELLQVLFVLTIIQYMLYEEKSYQLSKLGKNSNSL